MARRRTTAEVRQLLLDAASRSFAEKGYATATTDEIAERAGVSMSVLFRHFPSKSDLFREALLQPFVETMNAFTTSWNQSFDEQTTAEDVMRSLVAGLYDSLKAHEDSVAGLVAAADVIDPVVAEEIDQTVNAMFAQLCSMGEAEARRRGWFSADEMDMNARMLFSMVMGAVAYRRWFLPQGRKRLSRERVISHMTALLLYGLRLEPAGDENP